MEAIEKELAKRDRLRRHLERQFTPEQRLRQFWEMRARAIDTQSLWPEGHERFWRRNLRKRATSWRPKQ